MLTNELCIKALSLYCIRKTYAVKSGCSTENSTRPCCIRVSNELYVIAFKEELDDKGLLVFCNVGIVENLAIYRARKMS